MSCGVNSCVGRKANFDTANQIFAGGNTVEVFGVKTQERYGAIWIPEFFVDDFCVGRPVNNVLGLSC